MKNKLHPSSKWLFFGHYLFAGYILLVGCGLPAIRMHHLLIYPDTDFGIYILDHLTFYMTMLPILIVILTIAIYIYANLMYQSYSFELTDKYFRKELGVIQKKSVTIDYERIQNIDINRGILARMLGLAVLQIQTAGMSATTKSEGKLPGLTVEDTMQLRDELESKIHRQTDQA